MNVQERLKMVMKMHSMNAAQFADTIGVQRSSISHVLSGRNKPSLDFVEKILLHFPRVNADWLVTGKTKTNVEEIAEKKDYKQIAKEEEQGVYNKLTTQNTLQYKKEIKKIVVLYADNSFESFTPSEI